jgi:hypothetical protein
MDHAVIQTLALTLGAGWASGLNLYATILTLGLMNALGYATLPPDLAILSDPLVLAAAGFMYFIEFFADKTPGVDTGWDGIHTFIRIPAGAILAAGAASGFGVGPAAEFAAALVGGSLAAGSHFTKAGSRVLINTSPEPVSNWTASFVEDLAVIGGLWAALSHPWAFLVLLLVFVLALAWVLPRLWRAVKQLFAKLRGWLRGPAPSEPSADRKSRQDVLRQLYDKAKDEPPSSG